MAKQRSTFAKLQRDLDKKAKTAAKAERRANKSTEPEEDAPQVELLDESVVMEEMAKLQVALEEGTLSMDEFQSRREALTSRLQIN